MKVLDATRDAYKVISAVDGLKPVTQVTAVATVFEVMCSVLGLDPGETLAKIERARSDAYALDVRERFALEDYVRNELKAKQL